MYIFVSVCGYRIPSVSLLIVIKRICSIVHQSFSKSRQTNSPNGGIEIITQPKRNTGKWKLENECDEIWIKMKLFMLVFDLPIRFRLRCYTIFRWVLQTHTSPWIRLWYIEWIHVLSITRRKDTEGNEMGWLWKEKNKKCQTIIGYVIWK